VPVLDSTGGRRPREETSVLARLEDLYRGLRERWWPQVEQGMLEHALILVLVAVVVFVILGVIDNRANNGFPTVSGGLGE
jgi:Flp pilus assembly pilin Flp